MGCTSYMSLLFCKHSILIVEREMVVGWWVRLYLESCQILIHCAVLTRSAQKLPLCHSIVNVSSAWTWKPFARYVFLLAVSYLMELKVSIWDCYAKVIINNHLWSNGFSGSPLSPNTQSTYDCVLTLVFKTIV